MATVNSGLVMRVLPRTVLDFSGLAASGSMTIPLAQHIDATPFTEADMIVRFHGPTTSGGSTGSSISTATATVLIALVNEGWDFEDPATPLATASPPTGSSPGTVQVTSVSSFPFATTVQFNSSLSGSNPLGRYLSVAVIASMGTTTGTVRVTLSIDLVLKGGDASAIPMAPNSFRGYRVM